MLTSFISKKNKFQISSFKFGWMNPWWSFNPLKNGKHEWMLPDGVSKRSQDLPNLYCPTGAIWIANKKLLLKEKTFYGNGYNFHEIDWKSAADIDDYQDLDFTKAIYYLINNKFENV